MGRVAGPSPDDWSVFVELIAGTVERIERLQQLDIEALKIGTSTANLAGSAHTTFDDGLRDHTGQEQMGAVYFARNLLATRGEIRRLWIAAHELVHRLELSQRQFESLAPLVGRLEDVLAHEPSESHREAYVVPAAVDSIVQDAVAATGQLQRGGYGTDTDPELQRELGRNVLVAMDEAQLFFCEAGIVLPTELRGLAIDGESLIRRYWTSDLEDFFASVPGLRRDVDNLLACRMLSRSLRLRSASGVDMTMWDLFPWLTQRARGAWWSSDVGREELGAISASLDMLHLPEPSGGPVRSCLLDILSHWFEDDSGFKQRLGSGLPWPSGTGIINIIPAGYTGECTDTLVVVCTKRAQFREYSRQAVEHFFECTGTTKSVIFLADYWDGPYFTRERLGSFQRLALEYGVRTYLVLKSGHSIVTTLLAPIDGDGMTNPSREPRPQPPGAFLPMKGRTNLDSFGQPAGRVLEPENGEAPAPLAEVQGTNADSDIEEAADAITDAASQRHREVKVNEMLAQRASKASQVLIGKAAAIREERARAEERRAADKRIRQRVAATRDSLVGELQEFVKSLNAAAGQELLGYRENGRAISARIDQEGDDIDEVQVTWEERSLALRFSPTGELRIWVEYASADRSLLAEVTALSGGLKLDSHGVWRGDDGKQLDLAELLDTFVAEEPSEVINSGWFTQSSSRAQEDMQREGLKNMRRPRVR